MLKVNKLKYNKIKYLLLVLVLTFFLIILSGCSFSIGFVKEKTFTDEGLSITLTNRFYEKDHIAFTSYYESDKMMVVVIKEDFSLLSSVNITKNSTVEEYLDLIIVVNNHNTSVKEEDDIFYFDYEKTENGKEFKYVVTAVKGNQAFYLVQFCVIEDTYDELKQDIFKYASSLEAE